MFRLLCYFYFLECELSLGVLSFTGVDSAGKLVLPV